MRDELLNRLAADCCLDPEYGSVSPDVRGGRGRLYKGSSKKTTTQSVSTNTDKRQVVDGSSTGISLDGSGNSLTVLDQGAIAKAFDFSKTSTETASKTIAEALGLVSQSFQMQQANFNKTSDVLAQSAEGVKEAWTTASDTLSGNRTLVMLAVGAGALVALNAFKKRG